MSNDLKGQVRLILSNYANSLITYDHAIKQINEIFKPEQEESDLVTPFKIPSPLDPLFVRFSFSTQVYDARRGLEEIVFITRKLTEMEMFHGKNENLFIVAVEQFSSAMSTLTGIMCECMLEEIAEQINNKTEQQLGSNV